MDVAEKRDIVICDLDGTLALDDHRNHLIKRPVGERKWDEYFALCGQDEPNHPVVQLVRIMHFARKKIYILTGRVDSVRKQTLDWLELHNVPFNHLEMRRADSRTDDHLLKVQWAHELGISERIWLVLEDRKRVVDAWRAGGFPCLQVRPGDF